MPKSRSDCLKEIDIIARNWVKINSDKIYTDVDGFSFSMEKVRFYYLAITASVGYIITEEEIKSGWPGTHKYWPESVDLCCRISRTAKSKSDA